MPYSEKQRRFFGAEYSRAKAGKKTRTGMSMSELKEHASMPIKKGKMKSYGSLTLPAGCNVGEKRMMEAMKVGAQKFKPMGAVKMGGASPKGAKGGY